MIQNNFLQNELIYILYILAKISQFNRLKTQYSGKWFRMIYLLTKNKSSCCGDCNKCNKRK